MNFVENKGATEVNYYISFNEKLHWLCNQIAKSIITGVFNNSLINTQSAKQHTCEWIKYIDLDETLWLVQEWSRQLLRRPKHGHIYQSNTVD